MLYVYDTEKTVLAASGSINDSHSYSPEIGIIGEDYTTTTFYTAQYALDSKTTNYKTKSTTVAGSKGVPKPPILVSCKPLSSSSTSFQVTVKNPNSSAYFCNIRYNSSGGNSTDYWLATCPANGTGSMTNTIGGTTTFTFTRGALYVLTLYFYTKTGSSLSYTGTQVSRAVHYPFKAPDAGFLYASPIVVTPIYNADSAPSKVTFKIFNINDTTLKTEMDVYNGKNTSGTRVDYWMATVAAMSSATCPNSWSISPGKTYTLDCYFMNTSSSYHGTAVSGHVTYLFTVPR